MLCQKKDKLSYIDKLTFSNWVKFIHTLCRISVLSTQLNCPTYSGHTFSSIRSKIQAHTQKNNLRHINGLRRTIYCIVVMYRTLNTEICLMTSVHHRPTYCTASGKDIKPNYTKSLTIFIIT